MYAGVIVQRVEYPITMLSDDKSVHQYHSETELFSDLCGVKEEDDLGQDGFKFWDVTSIVEARRLDELTAVSKNLVVI